MNVRKVIRRRIRQRERGLDVVADVNAVVSANVNQPGSGSSVRSRQRIVQRSGTVPERSAKGGERDG